MRYCNNAATETASGRPSPQQQDFVPTIDNAGGNIGVLIAQLQNNIRKREAERR